MSIVLPGQLAGDDRLLGAALAILSTRSSAIRPTPVGPMIES